MDSTERNKSTREKSYVVADIHYYVVRSMMVVSVINMYRWFSIYYSLNNVVQQLFP